MSRMVVRGFLVLAAFGAAAAVCAVGCATAKPASEPANNNSSTGTNWGKLDADKVSFTPQHYYISTPREWRQYLGRMQNWMNTDAAEKQADSGNTKDTTQALRRGFSFKPGYDQPMPQFDAPAQWNCGYLSFPNTFDEPVRVNINGLPFGTMKPGALYRLPVLRGTRHVVDFYVTTYDLGERAVSPLKLKAHFVVDVN